MVETLGHHLFLDFNASPVLSSTGCLLEVGCLYWVSTMRILLVEDERKVASFIARALREDAYAVDIAETGEHALEMSDGVAHDLIVLDVRLPGLSGIQVCRELRQSGNSSPVLMLTARGLVEQRVGGVGCWR